jgi:hypothetical protein
MPEGPHADTSAQGPPKKAQIKRFFSGMRRLIFLALCLSIPIKAKPDMFIKPKYIAAYFSNSSLSCQNWRVQDLHVLLCPNMLQSHGRNAALRRQKLMAISLALVKQIASMFIIMFFGFLTIRLKALTMENTRL